MTVDVVVALSEATGLLEGVYCEYKSADILRDARDAIAELIAAVEERVEMSRRNGQSTGRFADSDARIDAALIACKGQDHER